MRSADFAGPELQSFGGNVFPNLTHLRWLPYADSDFPHIRLFITETVTDIYVSCKASASNLSLLTTTALGCRRLERFRVSHSEGTSPAHDPDARAIMSAFACELRFVEDVDMYIPDLSASSISRASKAAISGDG
ncbi:hypothetical protein B0H13DRAFT_2391863 [Mycena leptocephala]|nr:hypothetical protein B0H13DRAFT_2391863 [Mycena leptocephala]